MPEAPLGGTRIFWRNWGQGPRRALAIHAGLLQSGSWEGVAVRLPAGLDLQAFDMPGHGRSGPWDEARDYMDQTVAVALGLIAGAPVDLLGHSFGAVAALRIAVERPDLARSLVLYEPVFIAAAEARGTDTRAPNAGFAAALAAGDRDEAARRFTEVWGGHERWEDTPPRRRQALAARIHLVAAGAAAIHDDRAGLLAPGRLEATAVPTLLLEGTASPPVVHAIAEALALRLPNARRETVAGAGHMGPITHPAEVAEAIRRHLGL